jgi:MinD superfamily P-loop ATPase
LMGSGIAQVIFPTFFRIFGQLAKIWKPCCTHACICTRSRPMQSVMHAGWQWHVHARMAEWCIACMTVCPIAAEHMVNRDALKIRDAILYLCCSIDI